MDPAKRPSSEDVKLMPFFQTIDWDNLQMMEPPFIPQPENATDTGYFAGKAKRQSAANILVFNDSNTDILFELTARNNMQHLKLSVVDMEEFGRDWADMLNIDNSYL